MDTAVTAADMTYFIGATAISKESVNIVGSTTSAKDQISFTAPWPTTIPPKHPTISNTIEMIP